MVKQKLRFVPFCINALVTTHVLVVATSGREAPKIIEQK
jgi:hypothetical protein